MFRLLRLVGCRDIQGWVDSSKVLQYVRCCSPCRIIRSHRHRRDDHDGSMCALHHGACPIGLTGVLEGGAWWCASVCRCVCRCLRERETEKECVAMMTSRKVLGEFSYSSRSIVDGHETAPAGMHMWSPAAYRSHEECVPPHEDSLNRKPQELRS